MIDERIIFGLMLFAIIAIVWVCSISTRKHLYKWLLASLVMPVLVLIFQNIYDELVLLFWPGSIVLMSLGASEWPWIHIVYFWGLGITLNMGLYLLLGLMFYWLTHRSDAGKRLQNHELR